MRIKLIRLIAAAAAAAILMTMPVLGMRQGSRSKKRISKFDADAKEAKRRLTKENTELKQELNDVHWDHKITKSNNFKLTEYCEMLRKIVLKYDTRRVLKKLVLKTNTRRKKSGKLHYTSRDDNTEADRIHELEQKNVQLSLSLSNAKSDADTAAEKKFRDQIREHREKSDRVKEQLRRFQKQNPISQDQHTDIQRQMSDVQEENKKLQTALAGHTKKTSHAHTTGAGDHDLQSELFKAKADNKRLRLEFQAEKAKQKDFDSQWLGKLNTALLERKAERAAADALKDELCAIKGSLVNTHNDYRARAKKLVRDCEELKTKHLGSPIHGEVCSLQKDVELVQPELSNASGNPPRADISKLINAQSKVRELADKYHALNASKNAECDQKAALLQAERLRNQVAQRAVDDLKRQLSEKTPDSGLNSTLQDEREQRKAAQAETDALKKKLSAMKLERAQQLSGNIKEFEQAQPAGSAQKTQASEMHGRAINLQDQLGRNDQTSDEARDSLSKLEAEFVDLKKRHRDGLNTSRTWHDYLVPAGVAGTLGLLTGSYLYSWFWPTSDSLSEKDNVSLQTAIGLSCVLPVAGVAVGAGLTKLYCGKSKDSSQSDSAIVRSAWPWEPKDSKNKHTLGGRDPKLLIAVAIAMVCLLAFLYLRCWKGQHENLKRPVVDIENPAVHCRGLEDAPIRLRVTRTANKFPEQEVRVVRDSIHFGAETALQFAKKFQEFKQTKRSPSHLTAQYRRKDAMHPNVRNKDARQLDSSHPDLSRAGRMKDAVQNPGHKNTGARQLDSSHRDVRRKAAMQNPGPKNKGAHQLLDSSHPDVSYSVLPMKSEGWGNKASDTPLIGGEVSGIRPTEPANLGGVLPKGMFL